jgi:hypothetical protein
MLVSVTFNYDFEKFERKKLSSKVLLRLGSGSGNPHGAKKKCRKWANRILL